MSRSPTSRAAAAALLASLACCLLGCGAGRPEPAPGLPNLVLVTADDLGWLDVASYGNPDLETPHIDRLAREGLRFTRAFVTASSCSSSRATLVTGQYPHTNGVTGLTHRHLGANLSPLRETLADHLRATGYRTALIGKWHVASLVPTSLYGYDERLSSWIDPWIRDIRPALDFIERNRERPFYLEVNTMQTHRQDDGRFSFDPAFPVDPAGIRIPAYLALPDWPEIRAELARFYSQTMAMDAMIGELLAALDRLDLAENTIVVFVSDNGPPFPGSKMTLYDRGIAVPLIVRWPARLPAGEVRHAMVSTLDLLPTLLEAIGLAIPARVEGRSFLALLARGAADRHRDAIFAEMTHHVESIPTRAVRTERFKYIRNYSDASIDLDQLSDQEWAHRLCERPEQPWKRPRPHEELYDLTADPHEQHDLVDDPAHRATLDALRSRLDAHMAETHDPLLGAPFVREHPGSQS